MTTENKYLVVEDKELQVKIDAEIKKILGFLREREVVHYQRFGEALMDIQDNVKPGKFSCK